jgi:hypothetical protein
MAYHTIHQLRIVSRIYTRHTRINLFQPGPLYALSNLTAATAIGIAVPTWLWFWLISSASRARYVSDVLPSLFFGTIIAVTFVWPLLGAHRLLIREKQRLQDEVGRRMGSTIGALNEAVDADEVGGAAGALTNMLNGLIVEQGVINKLRTWPWQPGTVGGVGIAYLAPLIIWLLQRLLGRLGV